MMRHAAPILRARLGRPDIHPAVDLARIGVDDFRVEALGERHRGRRFADPGRPHDKADADRIRGERGRSAGPAVVSAKPGPVSLVGELCVTSENLSRDPIATRAETWKISQRLQLPKKNTR